MSNTLHCTSIRIKTQEVVGSFLMQYGCGCQQQHPSRRRADLLIHWCGRNPRAVTTGWLALAWVWACLGRSRFKALADQHGHYELPPHNNLLEWAFWCIHFASFCITGSCVIRILWEGVGSGPWPSCQVSLMPTELLVSNFGMCFWRTCSPRLSILIYLIWSRSNRSFLQSFTSQVLQLVRVGSGLFHLDPLRHVHRPPLEASKASVVRWFRDVQRCSEHGEVGHRLLAGRPCPTLQILDESGQ